jgi:beta-N-acetylhexosaminidase
MKKIFLLISAVVPVLCFSCSKQSDMELKNAAVKEFVSSLSESERVSQLFLVNIEGNREFIPVETTACIYDDRVKNEPLLAGGCLFFSYNIASSKSQIKDFVSSINSFYIKNNKIPPFLALDQEGGSVNRLRGITENFPSAKYIADNLSIDEAASLYERQAKAVRELGFTMNLAPVVEVETEENADFLDTRSFGNLEKVLSYAGAEIKAFENSGTGTVLKHFPGNTNTDPHTGLPEIRVSSEKLENELAAPFKSLLPFSSAVLMSHARITLSDQGSKAYKIPEGEERIPSCLSSYWVTDVLRNKFGFEGLIFSDDIFMGALQDNGFPPEDAAVQAVEAGIDVIMLSEKRFGSVAKILLEKAHLSREFSEKINRAAERVIWFKISKGLLTLEKNGLPSQKTKTEGYIVKVSEGL